MTLDVGQKVYYVGRGPCRVEAIVRKVVCGASAKFYSFRLLDDSGAEFLIPLGKSSDLPLRALLPRHAIPELLSRLETRAGPPRELGNWQQRESFKSRLFSSGSAFDLADLIESLTRASGIRHLANDERQALERARKLLIHEIAEVMHESKSAAEARVDTVCPNRQPTQLPNKSGSVEGGRKTT